MVRYGEYHMKNLPVTLLILFCSFTLTAHANESFLEESSGFLAPVRGDRTEIRMVSERVVIELGRTSYTVDASFEFMNDGNTITVLVGFPWKGAIGRAVFVVRTSPDVWIRSVPQFAQGGAFPNTRSYTKRRIGEFEHEYILSGVEPFEDEIFRVLTGWDYQKNMLQPWEVEGYFHFKDKPVGDDFLDILSLSQLRLFRNAFYALHGKKFGAPDLDAYFRNSEWYQPRNDYRDTNLTEIERENVRKIIAKEKWLKKLTRSIHKSFVVK
jgi:hypothetical protein